MDATASVRNVVLDALDRPARQALELARRPLWVTLGIGLLGAILIGVSSALSMGLDAAHFGRDVLPRVDVLRAVLEALAVVVPSALVLAGYFRMEITPRAMLSAVSIGLLIAGVVVVSTVPLLAYLTIAAIAKPMIAPGAGLPILALAAAAGTVGRIVRAIDRSPRARAFVFLFQAGLAAAFVARVAGL